jgi:membrane-bound ClpP family serine protease
VGIVGTTASPLEPEGTVFVREEYWSARSEAPVPAGAKVEVTEVEALRLRVRPAPPEPQ